MEATSTALSPAGGRQGFDRNLVVATVVGPMMSFASAPLLAAALGLDGRGTLAAVMAAFLIIRFISTFGGQEAALGAAFWEDFGPGASARAVTRWISPFALVFGALAWIAAPLMFRLDPEAVRVFRSVSILIPLAAVSDGLRFALIADRRSLPVVTHILAPDIVRLGGSIILVALSIDSVLAGAWISTSGFVVGFVAVALAARTIARGCTLSPPAEARFRRFALDLAPGQIARLGNRRLDQLLLGSVAGRSQLGTYAVAVALAELADLFTRAIRQLAMRSQTDDDGFELEQYFRLGLVLFLPATAGLAAAIPIVLPLFFPASFSGALWPAEILLLAGLANYVRDVLGVVLVSSDHARTESLFQASTLLVAVGGVLGLGWRFGATGASLAALVSYSFGAFMVIARYRRIRPEARLRDLVPGIDDLRNVRAMVVAR